MIIGFFELEGWEEKLIRERFPNDDLYFTKERLDEMHNPERTDLEVVCVFVGSHVTGEVAAKFPNLKLVATRSTGYDHVDVSGLKARGIPVAYVPGYGDNTVAEFAFGLILALSRKIYAAIDRIKESESFSLDGLRGIDLKGKVIGIVGTGRIGREAVRIARGFGMNILMFDPRPDEAFASEMGAKYVDLDTLLSGSDVVSLHCPLIPATKHLLNAANLPKMKKGSYLVNTARGGLIETGALVAALADGGPLAGAALDVIEDEGEAKDTVAEELRLLNNMNPEAAELKTMLENHMLMRMPNVLVTPHLAFNSQEALERILHTTLDNVAGFEAGTPQNVIAA